LALANAVVPEMMHQGWGRIVNVTTSLGTMLNAGSPTYGPSKAALEALSAIMAKDLDGTGVTVNVSVPSGVTDTPMISNEAGFDRAKLISRRLWCRRSSGSSPMPPGKWQADGFSESHWDATLPPEEAAEKAGALAAWTSIATMPITPQRSLIFVGRSEEIRALIDLLKRTIDEDRYQLSPRIQMLRGILAKVDFGDGPAGNRLPPFFRHYAAPVLVAGSAD
jgi:NAD(P)-dependent dehydrogenase (short-subunit alcohol dehydrogenase family)